MGVFAFSDEFTSPVPPARLFKALILDFGNLLPKLLPQLIKSVDFTQGNGEAGSIRQISFQDGIGLKSVTNRVEAVDPENLSYSYSLIEGEGLLDKMETIVYEVQFVPGPDGGSINKMKSTYHTKGDIVLTEEEVKEGKEKALGMYKAVEAYLLQNPEAYA
ncbi:major allergen Pru ar 1-like [Populus alba x Populus x berolinensis]|nr:major allergen Pru ar 1-like [Populus alba x Populus x berolinensis]KAJ6897739.1 major allergen Pru ar 1-like [Populus alba x Populus x berolinensis]